MKSVTRPAAGGAAPAKPAYLGAALLLDHDADSREYFADYFSETRFELLMPEDRAGLETALKRKPPVRLALINMAWPGGVTREDLMELKNQGSLVLTFGTPKDFIPDGPLTKPFANGDWEWIVYKRWPYGRAIKVLIVDDEIDICTELKKFLLFHPEPALDIDYALNGLEAFEKIRAARPDVLILDIKMPVRSGSELFRDLMRAGISIPTLVVSATVSAEELASIRRYGQAVFYEKGGHDSSFESLSRSIPRIAAFGFQPPRN